MGFEEMANDQIACAVDLKRIALTELVGQIAIAKD